MLEPLAEPPPRAPIIPAPYTTVQDPTAFHGQWWGHTKEHDWVVLDRSISGNQPGLKQILFFMRCKDMTTFTAKREMWKPPTFVFAPNYLRSLAAQEAPGAAATLEGFQARWPEMQVEIQRQYEATLPKPVDPPEVVKKPRKKKAVVAADGAAKTKKEKKEKVVVAPQADADAEDDNAEA